MACAAFYTFWNGSFYADFIKRDLHDFNGVFLFIINTIVPTDENVVNHLLI